LEQGRLIAFGCSFTYGHGLPDCIGPDNSALDKPSKVAWPNILGKLLEYKTVINDSIPGSSNKLIVSKITKFNFKKNDIVFILWTRTARHTVFKDYKNYITYMPAFIDKKMEPSFWKWISTKMEVSQFKKNVENYFTEFYEEFDARYDQVVRMNYIDTYLKSKGLDAYHLIIDTELNVNEFKHMLLPNLNYKVFQYETHFKIDVALDNNHPGVTSHKFFATRIRKWFF
jgi:hypothetical protein